MQQEKPPEVHNVDAPAQTQNSFGFLGNLAGSNSSPEPTESYVNVSEEPTEKKRKLAIVFIIEFLHNHM